MFLVSFPVSIGKLSSSGGKISPGSSTPLITQRLCNLVHATGMIFLAKMVEPHHFYEDICNQNIHLLFVLSAIKYPLKCQIHEIKSSSKTQIFYFVSVIGSNNMTNTVMF